MFSGKRMHSWWLAALLLASCLFNPGTASANNYQDMWWNPNESGWGINIAQQGDVMFATWFIYGLSNQPTWIFLSSATRSGVTGNTFAGDIFQASGSAFSAVPFVPLQAGNLTNVGRASVVFADSRTGTLTYSINGIEVVKQITRLNVGAFNLTGSYFGGLKREGGGCVSAALNGSVLNQAIYSVTYSVATGALTITEIGGTSCTFSGNTTTFGSLVEGSGRFTCAGENIIGAWTMREGRPSPNAFTALLTLRPDSDSCTLTATIGGLKP